MKDLEEALALVLDGIRPLESEHATLIDAAGRILTADARAVVDLPPFDRTAMDGYAVRAAEAGAPLRIAGDIAAGDAGEAPREPGTAVRISTGGALPPGADAILRVEDASVTDGFVSATAPVHLGEHVRVRGEDVREGDVLARAGARLTLQRLSALSSAGI